MQLKPLTPEEENIIINKGTEAPFSGKLVDEKRVGTFVCKRCQTPLYRSSDKLDTNCGRPSFDNAIPGKIQRTLDADGIRTEITCKQCGAHLGHVFVGEAITDKNTRHCVNSLSMEFIPDMVIPKNTEIATLGGGCFRCLDAAYRNIQGVIDVKSGYAGGKRPFPTYEQVCSGSTGYIEVVEVIYDPTIISYAQIVEIFFTIHDPTTLDRQGNDSGTQYASAIFYHNDIQKTIAETTIQKLTQENIRSDPIVTQIRPLEKFWMAEEYHQDYYTNHADKPYCQIVINPKINKLRKQRTSLLKNQ